jgi:excisionase family DNA binding protein
VIDPDSRQPGVTPRRDSAQHLGAGASGAGLPHPLTAVIATTTHEAEQGKGSEPASADGGAFFPLLPAGIRQVLYTPEQAGVLLAVHPSWLRRHAADGTLPHTRLGKHLRFSDADLSAIVAAGARGPRPPPIPPPAPSRH